MPLIAATFPIDVLSMLVVYVVVYIRHHSHLSVLRCSHASATAQRVTATVYACSFMMRHLSAADAATLLRYADAASARFARSLYRLTIYFLLFFDVAFDGRYHQASCCWSFRLAFTLRFMH